ncbi:MAG: hypothetical protein A2252_07175 [Elusimicrobia bacterium RIFOXYA2_FULL_39_19]|nr:MAG: hypothetical protein A2252_07175 [Elusimicrobia bacterium RIFOXYA2_FULL_39_19]
MNRAYIGKIPVDLLSWEEILSRLHGFVTEKNTPHQIVTLNSLMYNFAVSDTELEKAIASSSLVLPDSVGISFASRLLSKSKNTSRKPGIDLLLKLCALSHEHKYRIFILGSRQEVIRQTAENLKKLYPNMLLTGYLNGYFTNNLEVIEAIKQTSPDILFVGLDVPRQEKWIYENLHTLKVPVVMGIGGSFDVISGKLKRAPRLMQAVGLEWLYRLIQEPWRINRIKDLPVFAIKALKIVLSGNHG